MFRFDRKKFFDSYRKAFGPVEQLQVEGLEFLLGKIESDSKWESLPQVAYFLASIKHETGITRNNVYQAFQPIKELRSRPGTKGRANQDRYWLSNYYGRGYIQLTWQRNYAKFGLAEKPDKALEPDTAYMIAARGMREGLFTGKRLSDYITDGDVDYVNARKIVNGLDRANDIAAIAEKFERILKASLVTNSVTEHSPQPEVEKPKVEPPSQPTTPADVVVKAEEPKKTDPSEKAEVSGPKSWIAAAVTFVTAAGGGAVSWLNGASKEIVIGLFAAAAIVGTVYVVSRYWYRNKENQRLAEVQLKREQMAHEITLLKMKSAMDDTLNTVEVSHAEKN